ncbi:hypothetical protein AVEN_71443-1 [Araneus ventricosus]|uniref:Uncharacterized protein n=1 Tax=Araneus ventricosus TaxID=182803 RepID=A0A4Y2CXH6_ARAVE|nr:hypothetical protein AVEN_71443-1 [Araneus ventricosus]
MPYYLPSTVRRKTEPTLICEEETGLVTHGPMAMQKRLLQTGTLINGTQQVFRHIILHNANVLQQFARTFESLWLHRIDGHLTSCAKPVPFCYQNDVLTTLDPHTARTN